MLGVVELEKKKGSANMNQETIKKTEEILASLAGQDRGFCTIALIDENGFPTASTVSIIKASGINQLTFCVSLDDNKARRVKACNRAGVCVSSIDYNITLVGTAEILTDSKTKEEAWQPWFCEVGWSGPDDANFCVLRFITQRYNLYIGEQQVAGTI